MVLYLVSDLQYVVPVSSLQGFFAGQTSGYIQMLPYKYLNPQYLGNR